MTSDPKGGPLRLTARLLAQRYDYYREARRRQLALRNEDELLTDALDGSLHGMTRGRWHHDRILHELGPGADTYMMRLLFRFCEANGIVVHPALEPRRAHGNELTVFRDHVWEVTERVEPLTPLLAIPERLCIGFKDTSSHEDLAALKRGTTEEAKESIDSTAKEATAEESDGDVCAFFFSALSLLVNDLLVALNNPESDPRYLLARALQRTRTCHNAPYLSSQSFASQSGETTLAEVFLQMVHNFVQSGPLTGKVERDMLNWAVSVGLSHCTPLTVAGRRSVGVVPMLHLFPHGQDDVNATVVSRARLNDGAALSRYFQLMHPVLDLDSSTEYLYVVTTRALEAGDRVAIQAMAPVCNRSEEAELMWRLTCGAEPPSGSVTSSLYQEVMREVNAEVHRQAREL